MRCRKGLQALAISQLNTNCTQLNSGHRPAAYPTYVTHTSCTARGTAGVDVLSTVAAGRRNDFDKFGNKYFASYTGTAQAAANVAGVAALCLDALRRSCGASGGLGTSRAGTVVHRCITSGVDPVGGLANATRFGGRVNARKAVQCCARACPFSTLLVVLYILW